MSYATAAVTSNSGYRYNINVSATVNGHSVFFVLKGDAQTDNPPSATEADYDDFAQQILDTLAANSNFSIDGAAKYWPMGTDNPGASSTMTVTP